MIKVFTFLIFYLLLLTACSQDKDVIYIDLNDTIKDIQDIKSPKKSNVYYIGFDLRGEPQEDVAQYLPLLRYLHNSTGLNFKLSITPQNSSTEKELCSGQTDFSIMGGLSFIKAKTECEAQVLVKGLNSKNLATYRSMFIVKSRSKINSIEDLKNVKFAFGAKNSTQGYLIPKEVLSEHNILLKDFKSYEFTASHQKCAEAVLSGEYDVCSLQDTLAQKLAKEGLVKIIYKSRPYPSSLIAVSKTVPIEVKRKVKKALLLFDPLGKNKKDLYHWQDTEMPHGFTEANLSDYATLYNLAVNLGIIKADVKVNK